MKRGDIWTLQDDGYASKPRPVVIVQGNPVVRHRAEHPPAVPEGGGLMAAFSARRPARDIYWSSSGLPNDIADAERQVPAIVAAPPQAIS